MKTLSVVAFILLVVLSTTGFNCINDGYLVAVNLPVSAEFAINGGGNTLTASQGAVLDVHLKSQIDQSYLGKLKAVRMYDIRLTTIGDYDGTITNGQLTLQPQGQGAFVIADVNGKWSDFKAGKSVFQNTNAIVIHPPVLTTVGNIQTVLDGFLRNQELVVTLAASGNASPALPSGLRLRIEVLAQVDVDLGGGDNKN